MIMADALYRLAVTRMDQEAMVYNREVRFSYRRQRDPLPRIAGGLCD